MIRAVDHSDTAAVRTISVSAVVLTRPDGAVITEVFGTTADALLAAGAERARRRPGARRTERAGRGVVGGGGRRDLGPVATDAAALRLGGRLSEHQPQEEVRVLIDPAGHPFCVFVA